MITKLEILNRNIKRSRKLRECGPDRQWITRKESEELDASRSPLNPKFKPDIGFTPPQLTPFTDHIGVFDGVAETAAISVIIIAAAIGVSFGYFALIEYFS